MDVICNTCGNKMFRISEDTWKCPECNNRAYGKDEKHLYFQETDYVYDEIYGGYRYIDE